MWEGGGGNINTTKQMTGFSGESPKLQAFLPSGGTSKARLFNERGKRGGMRSLQDKQSAYTGSKKPHRYSDAAEGRLGEEISAVN